MGSQKDVLKTVRHVSEFFPKWLTVLIKVRLLKGSTITPPLRDGGFKKDVLLYRGGVGRPRQDQQANKGGKVYAKNQERLWGQKRSTCGRANR